MFIRPYNRESSAIFYAMKYSLKIGKKPEEQQKAWQQVIDGEYGYENALDAAKYLFSRGWSAEAVWIESLNAFTADLEQRAARGQTFRVLATVSHSGPIGPFFDNPEQPNFENNRAFLNAGWNWYGPGQVLKEEAGDGLASVAALRELTNRMKQIVIPNGYIIFIGCSTAKPSTQSRHEEIQDPRKEGTPFWIDDAGKIRYKSYAHAVADLSKVAVLGSTGATDLGDAKKLVRQFLFEGRVPEGWLLITPENARD